MSILDALTWRYAVKRFSDERLSESEVRSLLEATRLSASAFGLQPYKLLVISSRALRERLLPHAQGQDKVRDCSHLVVIAAETLGDSTVDRYTQQTASLAPLPKSAADGFATYVKQVLAGLTPEQRDVWSRQDAYLALGHLLASAAMMRIDCCPMSGFDPDGFDEVLGLGARGLRTTVICPLGRRHPSDEQAKRPKVRRSFDELVEEL